MSYRSTDNMNADAVLGIAAFTVRFIEPAIIKLKDKLFPPSQKTLDKRLTGYADVYLFGLEGALGIMKDAIKKGASPNTTIDRHNSEWEKTGTEPLLVKVARFDSMPLLKLLIENGAKVNATDSNGETALFATARNGSTVATKYLLDAGIEPTVVEKANRDAMFVAEASHAGGVAKLIKAALSFNAAADKPAANDTKPTPADEPSGRFQRYDAKPA